MLATEQRNSSPSPSRAGGLGSKISSLGAKLSKTFSGTHDEDRDSVHSELPIVNKERSQSRGREALQSTGRGGFGNIRQASLSRDRAADGPDDFSATRGREPIAHQNAPIYSTGRGGAGNLRSPSRGHAAEIDAAEREVIEKHVAQQGDVPVSTGRGGLGNIARSRSRDPSRTRVVTSGRGGAGNVHEGDAYDANAVDERERRKEAQPTEGLHSTGRGGFANITEQDEPALERPSISKESGYTGRGGVGNIVRN